MTAPADDHDQNLSDWARTELDAAAAGGGAGGAAVVVEQTDGGARASEAAGAAAAGAPAGGGTFQVAGAPMQAWQPQSDPAAMTANVVADARARASQPVDLNPAPVESRAPAIDPAAEEIVEPGFDIQATGAPPPIGTLPTNICRLEAIYEAY